MNVIPHSMPYYLEDDYQAIIGCLKSNHTASGGQNSLNLKSEIAHYFNAKKVLLTSSGSTALMLGLISVGVKPGDSIIIPNYLCREVYDAIRFISAIPIIVDIDRKTYTLNVNTVSKHINSNVKAIIVPHMFGIPGEIQSLFRYNIPIIEDLSQGLGAEIDKRRVGTFGDAAILSFKAIKMLGGGEGGALILNSPVARNNIINYINGKSNFPPVLFEMSDLTASITLSQFTKLAEFVQLRKKIAKKYLASFKNLNIYLPDDSESYSWFRFPITINNDCSTDKILSEYLKAGVSVRRPVDYLLSKKLQVKGEYPISEEVIKNTISIPLYPALNEDDIAKIINATKRIFG